MLSTRTVDKQSARSNEHGSADGTRLCNCARHGCILPTAGSADTGSATHPEISRRQPQIPLLAVADVRDIVDQVAEEYFTPFASGDLTGDGVPEVAAVIVQRGTSIRFGVVVAHGSRTVQSVLRSQSDKIVSVAIQQTRGSISSTASNAMRTPLFVGTDRVTRSFSGSSAIIRQPTISNQAVGRFH
jgi:hypothetical protein